MKQYRFYKIFGDPLDKIRVSESSETTVCFYKTLQSFLNYLESSGRKKKVKFINAIIFEVYWIIVVLSDF